MEITVRLVHPSIPVRTYDVIVRTPEDPVSDCLEDLDADVALSVLTRVLHVPFDEAVAMLIDADYGLTDEELEECDRERRMLAGFC